MPAPITALLDPVEVDPFQKIVLEEHHRDEDEARYECEARKVVHILCGLRNLREGVGSNQRQQHNFAERDVKTSQPENHEGYRREPMRKSFNSLEAKDFLSGSPRSNPDSSDDHISQAQEQDRPDDDDSAAPMQQDLVEVVPCSSNRLLQDGSLQVGNVDAAFDTGRLL
jgi:hypothetical protein